MNNSDLKINLFDTILSELKEYKGTRETLYKLMNDFNLGDSELLEIGFSKEDIEYVNENINEFSDVIVLPASFWD